MSDTTCTDNPAANHGFNRTASSIENRYVCDCEGWTPNRAMFDAVCEATRILSEAAESFVWDEDSYERKVLELEAQVAALKKIIQYQEVMSEGCDESNYDMECLGRDGMWNAIVDAKALIQEQKLVLTGDVFVDGDVLAKGYPHHKESE